MEARAVPYPPPRTWYSKVNIPSGKVESHCRERVALFIACLALGVNCCYGCAPTSTTIVSSSKGGNGISLMPSSISLVRGTAFNSSSTAKECFAKKAGRSRGTSSSAAARALAASFVEGEARGLLLTRTPLFLIPSTAIGGGTVHPIPLSLPDRSPADSHVSHSVGSDIEFWRTTTYRTSAFWPAKGRRAFSNFDIIPRSRSSSARGLCKTRSRFSLSSCFGNNIVD